MKRLANPPPRPTALWAATLVVSLQCWSVPIWLYVAAFSAGWGRSQFLFALIASFLAAALLGGQAVAVFRRQWAGSWFAAATVGFVFVVPGGFCTASIPVGLLGLAVNDVPDPGVFWVIALEGLWAVAVLFAGAVMLWWAARLYRWRVAPPRPRGRRASRTATADAATPP